ncbi:MAG: hypothetical protein PHT59_06185 [Candidatus Omnitrophica bacterium]|nr:hypothetical protein [Candidatus Omnitrophota bacterium]
MRVRIFLAVVWSFFLCGVAVAGDLMQIPCVIQVSSLVSDGSYSADEIVRAAQESGFKAVVLTDRDLMRWEYGVWPLRRVIKRTVQEKSIFTFGIRRYLDLVAEVQEKNKDIIVIPGIESAPFYYWQGEVLDETFVLKDWHKHFITMGIEDAASLERLPIIGNPRGLMQPFRFRDTLLLWPLALVVIGVACLKRRSSGYSDETGRPLGPAAKRWRIAGVLLCCAGSVFLMNNFPFRTVLFDQYHGDQKALPYQNYIDYVSLRGGLVFWAHPDIENVSSDGPVKIRTQAYPLDLYRTRGYTGFTLLYEGLKQTGAVGGVWDRLLSAYCRVPGRQPVWAIAALGFDDGPDLAKALKDLRTVVLADSFTREAIFRALRQGRCYIVRGPASRDFVLEEFSVSDARTGTAKTSGETLDAQGPCMVTVRGNLLRGQPQGFKIQLVKNGEVVDTREGQSPFTVTFDDLAVEENSFYRCVIESAQATVYTNPVFVRKKAGQ